MNADLQQLIAGEKPYILVGCDELPPEGVLLPGSFNPFHAGHDALLRAAEKTSGRMGLLELSVVNVDKPPLDPSEVRRRLMQFNGDYCAVLTCAPTFIEKAELFPGFWFAMGYDTALRLLSLHYHADVPAMLTHFRRLGTRFIVAGRLHNGLFQGVAQLNIPPGYEDLFIPIPEEVFREDISSTLLRNKGV